MDLQPARTWHLALMGWMACVCVGCAAGAGRPTPFTLVGTSGATRTYESAHFLLHTTIPDPARAGPMIQTLEVGLRGYEKVTGVSARPDRAKMDVYVFQLREEWQAFTTARTGHDAPIYLQLDRGGYTYQRFCAVRDQGEYDTLTVLAHEGLHLFISAHFDERPPPFVEEGLAVMFESVHRHEQSAEIRIDRNDPRARILARSRASGEAPVSLRKLLGMHAGNVVGSSERTIDSFYAQAWAFARYLLDPATPRSRCDGFKALIRDAASGALSSRDLEGGPALVERYLGEPLEAIEGDYHAFCERLGERTGENRE